LVLRVAAIGNTLSRMPILTCKLSAELDARLASVSRARRTTKSAVVRELLETQLSRRSARKEMSAFDLVKHVVGRLSGPRDLSSNPRHLDGFGE
jgi:predicted transcriptional regulator